jgi:hypothetical protein
VRDASGNLVGASAANPVRIDPTGTTVQPVSGTITANQGTSPWVVSLASTTITGSVAVTGTFFQATQPVSGTITALQGTSPWVVSGAVTVSGTIAATQSGTWTVGISAGQTIAVTNTGTFAVQATQSGTWNVGVTGTVAVTQSTSPWVVSGTVTANAGTGNFTVVQPTGTNLHVVVDSGVITSITNPVAVTGTFFPALQNVNVTQWDTTALGAPSAYGTSPGAVNVIGVNAFITNTVPVTLASTTITGTVAVTQSTSPWVVSLASTTITGTVAENLTQVAGVVLGATGVVAYGSTPAAVNVPAVNAFITNTVPVTLASTTITGNVTVVQPTGTNLHVVIDSGSTITATVSGNRSNNTAVPGATNIGALVAQALTTPAAGYTTGNEVLLVTDLAGNTNTDLQAYNNNAVVGDGINGLIPVGNYGTSVTADATWTSATGLNTAVTLVSNIEGYSSIAITLNQTGTLTAGAVTFEISNDNTNWYPVEGVDPNTGVIVPSTYTLVIGYFIFLFTVPTPYFRVRLSTAIVGSGTLIIGHNVKTLPQVHNIAGIISGTIGGALTNNNAAPVATLLGVLPAIAETAYNTITYTTGNQVLPVTDLHGALNTDEQAVAGVQLGATAVVAFGAAPAAVNVPAVNASIFAGVTPVTATGSSLNVNVTNTVSGNPIAGNLTNNNAAPAASNVGSLVALANAVSPLWTEGNQVLLSTDLHGGQREIGGNIPEITAAWTSATGVNTALTLTPILGYGTVVVTLMGTGTVTPGVVTFEVSDTAAGTNWYVIQGSLTVAGNPASTSTLVAENNAYFFNVEGWAAFRVRLSTAITGSGTTNVGIQAGAFPVATSTTIANQLGVRSTVGANAASDNQSNTTFFTDSGNVSDPLAVGDWVYGGAFSGTTDAVRRGWSKMRASTVFRTVAATASGNTVIWTPGSGNKFRLLQLFIQVSDNASLAAGGVLTVDIQDATTSTNITFSVFVPTTAVTTVIGDGAEVSLNLGAIGILSAAANNTLNVNLSVALATGVCRIIAMGTEE